jgi:hypothetical protein
MSMRAVPTRHARRDPFDEKCSSLCPGMDRMTLAPQPIANDEHNVAPSHRSFQKAAAFARARDDSAGMDRLMDGPQGTNDVERLAAKEIVNE